MGYVNKLVEHLTRNTRVISNSTVGSTDLVLVDENTGEIREFLIKSTNHKVIDNDTFIKLFKNNIKLTNLRLSQTACWIIFYIIENLQQNSIEIELKPSYLKELFNLLSYNPIYKAIKELIKYDIIKETDIKYLYEVNPMVLFNGNRFNFIKKKITITPDGYKITEYYQLKGNKIK